MPQTQPENPFSPRAIELALTLAEVAELERLTELSRRAAAFGKAPHGTARRFAELIARHRPPLYPKTPDTAA